MGTYSLTEEECLKIGGHCYKVLDSVIVTFPPIFTRICKHCGHKQEGIERDSISWKDVGDK